jgi:hypothetical protein|eukprot:COSAG01_NODE_9719_length_2362_cov_443.650906_1_plen_151_part_00
MNAGGDTSRKRKRGDPPTTSDDGTPLWEEGFDQVHSLTSRLPDDQITAIRRQAARRYYSPSRGTCQLYSPLFRRGTESNTEVRALLRRRGATESLLGLAMGGYGGSISFLAQFVLRMLRVSELEPQDFVDEFSRIHRELARESRYGSDLA